MAKWLNILPFLLCHVFRDHILLMVYQNVLLPDICVGPKKKVSVAIWRSFNIQILSEGKMCHNIPSVECIPPPRPDRTHSLIPDTLMWIHLFSYQDQNRRDTSDLIGSLPLSRTAAKPNWVFSGLRHIVHLSVVEICQLTNQQTNTTLRNPETLRQITTDPCGLWTALCVNGEN